MDVSQVYILISISILLIIAFLVFFVGAGKNRKKEKLGPLAGFAFAFIIAGIVFGENRLVGYSLIGIGVLLALIDRFIKLRKSKKKDNHKEK